MSPTHALHLMTNQERLELAGYQFTFSPPLLPGGRWAVFVYHHDLGTRPAFRAAQRHDALAQALHFALMTEGTGRNEENRDTLPAPAPEVAAE